jgi:hypothetical protein
LAEQNSLLELAVELLRLRELSGPVLEGDAEGFVPAPEGMLLNFHV